MLKGYLASFNMVADFASSEASAIQLIEKVAEDNGKPYNLLIVDYETPHDGGIEFFSKIKNLPSLKEIPKCIMMIPLIREDLFERIEVAGIDFGISKPIIPSLLYNGIVELFKTKVLEIHDSSALRGKQDAFTVEYPYHILIVEDNKTNQFIAQSILEQAGFKVSLSDDGKEGYEFFVQNQNDLDLILMDLHMPILNGFDSTSLIRKINSEIPIIAMTADAISGVEEKCISVGINHYISKPFEPDQFIETIVRVLKSLKEIKTKREEVDGKRDRFSDIQPVLDEADGIRHLGGNVDLYKMVLKEYHSENTHVPSLLKEKIKNKDYKEAVQIVHKIKSSSGSIGAKSLCVVASELQKALNDEDVPEISVVHKEFQNILNQLLREIKQQIKECD